MFVFFQSVWHGKLFIFFFHLETISIFCSVCLKVRWNWTDSLVIIVRFACETEDFANSFKSCFCFKDQLCSPIWLVSQLRPHLNVCLFCFVNSIYYANLHHYQFLFVFAMFFLYHFCRSLRFSPNFEENSAERYIFKGVPTCCSTIFVLKSVKIPFLLLKNYTVQQNVRFSELFFGTLSRDL